MTPPGTHSPEFRDWDCLSAWLTTAAPSICNALILDRPGKSTLGFTWGHWQQKFKFKHRKNQSPALSMCPHFPFHSVPELLVLFSLVFSFDSIWFYFGHGHGQPHFTFLGNRWRANYVNICHDRMTIFVQTLIHFLRGQNLMELCPEWQ